MTRVRLLIDALHARAGGGVTYLRNMLPLLVRDPRMDVILLIHADQRALFEPLDEAVRLAEVSFRSSFLGRLVWEQIVLPWRARSWGVDVTFSPANFCPLLAPRPVILLRNTIDAAETERRLPMRIYWKALALMTRASLARSRRAIAVSAYARDVLAGRDRHGVTVVHHGVDRRFFHAPARRAPEPFVLAVGMFYQQKNYQRLIRAFADVRRRFPDHTLRIAGGAPEGENAGLASLRTLIRSLGIESSVAFLGPRSPAELGELYRRCALFVFPSTAETFGQPLVEAMACGAPIACSNVAAMPEIVGEAALLFDPRDEHAIAEAIAAVLGDPGLAAELSEKSLARAARFSWEETARRTADILIEAAGRNPAQAAGTRCSRGMPAAGA